MATMRRASWPSSESVPTRSRKSMSSSMLMRLESALRSGRNPVATPTRGGVDVGRVQRGGPAFWRKMLDGAASTKGASRHQLVAAGLGHQDGRIGGIALDLLPQPVDMRLERVGGDAGIVAPHFLQKDLARDRALPGAIEVAQDRGLLLGQTHLVALGIDEQLRARTERVGADGEHGVLAGLVLA